MNQPQSASPPSASKPPCVLPWQARIVEVESENFNTHTLRLELVDRQVRAQYRWRPGQFNMIWASGVGEAAISISSNPKENASLSHTIRIVGSVTRAVTRLGVGGIVGLRGPFGHGWPMRDLRGRDVVIVAGGIGLAPLRPVIYTVLDDRASFGRVVLLYGCRTPEDRLYARELESWQRSGQIDVLVTVDNATPGWIGPVGVVTRLLQRIRVNAERTSVLVCGPRMLNRVAAWNFLQLHVPPERVFISLERNMNCGYGLCGHCQYGGKFVCRDGPVFAFKQIQGIFATDEI